MHQMWPMGLSKMAIIMWGVKKKERQTLIFFSCPFDYKKDLLLNPFIILICLMAFRSCRKPVIDFSGMVTSASSPVKNGAILCTRGRNFSFCFLAHWRFASKLIHPQTGGKTPKSKWRPFSCIFPKHNFWEKSFRFHPLWSRRTLDRTQKKRARLWQSR